MSKTSPTQRTLAALKAEGFTAAIVEKWNPHARIRQDLFGIGDVLAIRPGELPLLVQCTAGSCHAARVGKAIATRALSVWLLANGRFEIWSWAKRGPRGKAKVWTCRRQPLTLLDVYAAAGPTPEPPTLDSSQ
jgi:hypothetical protein